MMKDEKTVGEYQKIGYRQQPEVGGGYILPEEKENSDNFILYSIIGI
ncbi:hypothetical protein [Cytobacillus firmus]|nr:hypothetical protein [Cytobacillus firmus]MBX9975106.1 hypothetical protein [Cytobacillus firmus]